MRTPLAPGRRGPLLASALGLAIGLAVAAPARAEPLPSGSLGVMFGAGGGTGKYARTLGLGYYQFGAQAAWQPMTTERRIGWSLKWSFVFGTMYGADSARIDLYAHVLARAEAKHEPGAVAHAAKIASRACDGGATRKYDSLRSPLTLRRGSDKCDDDYKE